MTPLKIKLTDSQKEIAVLALTLRHAKRDPYVRGVPPLIIGDTLISDPTDFIVLMACVPRSPEATFKAYEIQQAGLSQIEARLARSTRESTRLVYSQLLDHARTTFGIGTLGNNAVTAQSKRPPIPTEPRLRLVYSSPNR